MTTLRSALIASAAASQAAYPQYAGRFDAMLLGRAKRATKTKAGVAVVAGEAVIFEHGENPAFVTIWSASNRCLTSVKASTIETV